MKKNYLRLFAVFIVLLILWQCPAGAFAQAPSFDLKSKSAILMDCGSGAIIYQKNAHERLPVASITKIMTILLALEAIEEGKVKLDDVVTVSEYAATMGGSQVFLAPGEKFPFSTLMKAVVVASANDASVAIAEKLAGSHEVFVQEMNRRAKELGMKNTHFVNCTGLPAEGHYSTAYDVALMSRELMKHPLFFKWSTIWLDYMRDGKTMLVNTNRLIRFYDGCDGIKTGSTSEAKFCLSATAKRDNLRFIAVVLGAPTSKVRFNEARKLLDWGFANYRSEIPIKKGQIIKEGIPVTGGKINKINGVAADNISVLVEKGASFDLVPEVDIQTPLKAPIKKGEKIGTVSLQMNGKVAGMVDVLAAEEVEVASVFDYLLKVIKNWLGGKV